MSYYRIAAAAGRRFLPTPSLAPPSEPEDAYIAKVDATSPVGHWSFAANLVDSVAGRNASLGAGSAVYVDGLVTGAPSGAFNCGGTNWLAVTHAAALKPAVGSLMTWVKPAALHTGVVLAVNASGSTNPADFRIYTTDTGSIGVMFQEGGVTSIVVTALPYYAVGQVVHVLVTFDTNGFTLYLDGNAIGSSNGHTTGFTGNTLDWRFGWQHATDMTIFNGALDEIAMWNRVLTSLEIYRMANVEFDE